MKQKELTISEGVAMIAGTGIGSGVMAIPYILKEAGIVGGIVAFACAYFLSVLLHFLVADTILNAKIYDIPSAIDKYLFFGKHKNIWQPVLFLLVLIMLVANLCAYIIGGAEIISTLFPVNIFFAKIIFYALALMLVFFGIKAIGIGEKYLVALICCLVVFFFAVSLTHPNGNITVMKSWKSALSMFSITMFSMTALFAVPEVVKGMNGNAVKIKKSIIGGLSLNLIITVIVSVSVVISSENITPMAAVGWSESLSVVLGKFIGIFELLALMTSFFVIAFSCSSIFSSYFKINMRSGFILATLPSLLLAFVPFSSFTGLTKTASGVISILIVAIIIPAYRCSVQRTGNSPLIGKIGKSKSVITVSAIGVLLMTLGSLM